MNSSKRKFQTLLNGLGARSSTSVNEVNTDTTIPTRSSTSQDAQPKRVRTGHPGSDNGVPILSARGSIFTSSAHVNISHKKAASVATATASKEALVSPVVPNYAPKYNPYDRLAFLLRLKTYSKLLDWSQKPSRVDAVEWAKRGWICQKNERVRCDYCYIEIVVKVNVKEVDGIEKPVYVASNIEESLVDKYADMIITAHSGNCPWRQRGCGDSIFHLTLNNAPATLQTLRERYNTLCVMSDKLPYIHNIRTSDEYDLDQILVYFPKDFFSNLAEGDSQPEINRVAIFLALCGWHGDPNFNAKFGSASCASCFRNLGLWLFKSKQVDENGAVVEIAAMSHLDPVNEHRDYCPWKNGQSQNGSGNSNVPSLPAWQIMIQVLKNNHYLVEVANPEVDARPRSATLMKARPTSSGDMDGDDEKARDEKDKRRQGRLSRIKSLFELKGANKLQRTPAVDIKHGSN